MKNNILPSTCNQKMHFPIEPIRAKWLDSIKVVTVLLIMIILLLPHLVTGQTDPSSNEAFQKLKLKIEASINELEEQNSELYKIRELSAAFYEENRDYILKLYYNAFVSNNPCEKIEKVEKEINAYAVLVLDLANTYDTYITKAKTLLANCDTKQDGKKVIQAHKEAVKIVADMTQQGKHLTDLIQTRDKLLEEHQKFLSKQNPQFDKDDPVKVFRTVTSQKIAELWMLVSLSIDEFLMQRIKISELTERISSDITEHASYKSSVNTRVLIQKDERDDLKNQIEEYLYFLEKPAYKEILNKLGSQRRIYIKPCEKNPKTEQAQLNAQMLVANAILDLAIHDYIPDEAAQCGSSHPTGRDNQVAVSDPQEENQNPENDQNITEINPDQEENEPVELDSNPLSLLDLSMGFQDDEPANQPSRNAETVTYFDRSFMPDSWRTSGNSQLTRVHLFSLGSRIGWAGALTAWSGPKAASLIREHLESVSSHVRGANEFSFMPLKAYPDWERIQKKHQYWIKRIGPEKNDKQIIDQLKILKTSLKGHALALADKVALQAKGQGIEHQENCDAYYVRIGYYLGYASQAMQYAHQAEQNGIDRLEISRISKDARAAANLAVRYMRGLDELMLATGSCIDLEDIAEEVYQGIRGGRTLESMAQILHEKWQSTLIALGGHAIEGAYDLNKIGQYVFGDMQRLEPPNLYKVEQNLLLPREENGYGSYYYRYQKSFPFKYYTDNNPGLSAGLYYKDTEYLKSFYLPEKCIEKNRTKIIGKRQGEILEGEYTYCIRFTPSDPKQPEEDDGQTTNFLWIYGDWAITLFVWDYPNRSDALYGPGDNGLKYALKVLNNLVPRLEKALELFPPSSTNHNQ